MRRTRLLVAAVAAILMMSLLAESASACCHRVRRRRCRDCCVQRSQCAVQPSCGQFVVAYASYEPDACPTTATTRAQPSPQWPVAIPLPPGKSLPAPQEPIKSTPREPSKAAPQA